MRKAISNMILFLNISIGSTWEETSNDLQKVATYVKEWNIFNCKIECAYQFGQAKERNEVLSVDFYGPLPTSVGGVQFLFVVQDLFSKFVTLYPIKRATTKFILKKLSELYFPKMGKPGRLFLGTVDISYMLRQAIRRRVSMWASIVWNLFYWNSRGVPSSMPLLFTRVCFTRARSRDPTRARSSGPTRARCKGDLHHLLW